MNQTSAIWAACRHQIIIGIKNTAVIGTMIVGIPTAAAVTYLAKESGNSALLAYIVFGVPVMVMSNGLIFGVGQSLNSEIRTGTLEFSLISRTSLLTIAVGKTLGQLLASTVGGILALITVLIVAAGAIELPNIGIVLLSLPTVLVALVLTSVFFAPWSVLMGGRAGFFNIFMPLVTVLSGYAVPVIQLPLALRVISWFFPGSWATSGLWQSLQWTGQWQSFLAAQFTSILVSFSWWLMIRSMFIAVEKRVRLSGTIGTY